MKQIRLIPNTEKGENIFHCWDATNSFYVHTGRGKRGIDNAYSQISKQYPRITMSITYGAYKKEVVQYFN